MTAEDLQPSFEPEPTNTGIVPPDLMTPDAADAVDDGYQQFSTDDDNAGTDDSSTDWQ